MVPTDPITLRTFDGGDHTVTTQGRPDRYGHLRHLPDQFTVRGGGYAYSPASFAADRPVIQLGAFNRILRFEPTAHEIDVEAGITLAQLLAFLTPRGWWCPVIPGYPAITVGGCIAGDVHGKSHSLHGNFRHWVKRLWLAGPKGLEMCDAVQDPELFALTCGGLGLTGPIIRATLRITPLVGGRVTTHREPVADLQEGYAALLRVGPATEFAYSWHRPWCIGDRRFGPGFAFHGSIESGSPLPRATDFAFSPLASDAHDRRLPFALFGGPGNRRTRAIYAAASLLETSKGMMNDSLFTSLFPFVRQAHYFQLFGKRGFQEVQVLVAHEAAPAFLSELEALSRKLPPPAAVIALKLFHGQATGIRFDGTGLGLALDLVRNPATSAFLTHFDQLCVAHRARLNLMKDSRLERSVFEACCPAADEFRLALRRRGIAGRNTSTLAQRLGLE